MNEQLLIAWDTFFKALGFSCRRLHDAPNPTLEVINFFGNSKHMVWMPVPVFPKHGLIEAAGRYADSLDWPVYLVVGPPEIPQVKQWPDGFLSAEGAVVLSFAPSSDRLGDVPPFRYDLRWHALQEDYWGSLDIWPLYATDLPLQEKTYTMSSLCLAVLGEPVPSVYCGCGRTPAGPRLRAAFEAAIDKSEPLLSKT